MRYDHGIDLHDMEDRIGEKEHRDPNAEREHTPGDHRRADLPFQFPIFTGPEQVPDQNAGSETDPLYEHDDKRHDRVARADSSQRRAADELSDDNAVDGIVRQLKNIAEHQGDREPDDDRKERPFREIPHGAFIFSFFRLHQ